MSRNTLGSCFEADDENLRKNNGLEDDMKRLGTSSMMNGSTNSTKGFQGGFDDDSSRNKNNNGMGNGGLGNGLGNASDIQFKDMENENEFTNNSPSSTTSKNVIPEKIFIIPPILTFLQMWGPTLTVFFFLGVFMFVLMWLYVYISFQGYQDRITVLSLGNLFNEDPQDRFETYVKQTAQESIAAAMQDVQSSKNDVITSVNRLQSQLNANQSQHQTLIDTVLQPLLNKMTTACFKPDSKTISSVSTPP